MHVSLGTVSYVTVHVPDFQWGQRASAKSAVDVELTRAHVHATCIRLVYAHSC